MRCSAASTSALSAPGDEVVICVAAESLLPESAARSVARGEHAATVASRQKAKARRRGIPRLRESVSSCSAKARSLRVDLDRLTNAPLPLACALVAPFSGDAHAT